GERFYGGAHTLRGDRDRDELGIGQRLGGVRGGSDGRWQADPRQVLLVGVGPVDLLTHVLAAPPERDRAPGVGQDGGEGGPPAAGAQHARPGHRGLRSGQGAPPCAARRMSYRTAGADSPRTSSSSAVIAAITRSVASRSV